MVGGDAGSRWESEGKIFVTEVYRNLREDEALVWPSKHLKIIFQFDEKFTIIPLKLKSLQRKFVTFSYFQISASRTQLHPNTAQTATSAT